MMSDDKQKNKEINKDSEELSDDAKQEINFEEKLKRKSEDDDNLPDWFG